RGETISHPAKLIAQGRKLDFDLLHRSHHARDPGFLITKRRRVDNRDGGWRRRRSCLCLCQDRKRRESCNGDNYAKYFHLFCSLKFVATVGDECELLL